MPLSKVQMCKTSTVAAHNNCTNGVNQIVVHVPNHQRTFAGIAEQVCVWLAYHHVKNHKSWDTAASSTCLEATHTAMLTIQDPAGRFTLFFLQKHKHLLLTYYKPACTDNNHKLLKIKYTRLRESSQCKASRTALAALLASMSWK